MKTEDNKVECDICHKIITGKFRHIDIYVTNFEDVYVQESCCGTEKELDVCNDCILNLNFRPVIEESKNDTINTHRQSS